MSQRVVCLVGAGNIRCAPPVLGALGAWRPDDGAVVSLFDANEERLDLVDRLARRIFDDFNKELVVRASSELSETLEGATDVILSLNEDGSRRMVGGQSSEDLHDVENDDSMLFRRGDGNRPTPVEQLSPMTRQLLSKPKAMDLSREDAIRAALGVFEEAWGGDGRVLSLIRGVEVEYESVDEPAALTDSELWMRPHQILRWIGRDELVDELIENGKSSSVFGWLTR